MKTILKQLLAYFLKGLLVFVPLAVTVFLIVSIFTWLDSWFRDIFRITIPGLGLLITLVGITVIGILASNFLGRRAFALIEKVFTKVPLVRLLYNALRDLVSAFAGEKKKFDKPVIVTLSRENGVKAVGFITRQSLDHFGLKDHVAVYMPQSYNFAGQVLIFPAQAVTPLDINSSDAMTFIVSGGVAGEDTPNHSTKQPE